MNLSLLLLSLQEGKTAINDSTIIVLGLKLLFLFLFISSTKNETHFGHTFFFFFFSYFVSKKTPEFTKGITA